MSGCNEPLASVRELLAVSQREPARPDVTCDELKITVAHVVVGLIELVVSVGVRLLLNRAPSSGDGRGAEAVAVGGSMPEVRQGRIVGEASNRWSSRRLRRDRQPGVL